MEAAASTDTREAIFAILPPIFRDCVDAESVRYDLSTPFVVDGYVYATDGKICVRLPATPEVVEACDAHDKARPPNRRPKTFAEVFAGEFLPEPIAFPAASVLPACDECGGKGSVPARKCAECHGSGTVECYACNYEHDCDVCGGKCNIPGGKCGECGGFGSGRGYLAGEPLAPGARVAHQIVHILDRHAAVVYQPEGDKLHARSFKFAVGTIEGRFSPRKPGDGA